MSPYRPDLVDCWMFRVGRTARDIAKPEILLIRRAPGRILPGLWQCVSGSLEAGETITAGALRELREETGYEGGQARVLGQTLPNPAIMSNICHTVLVENCHCVHPVQFDHGEDILTRLIPVADIPKLVAEGKINHSLVVVALFHFDLWERGLKPA